MKNNLFFFVFALLMLTLNNASDAQQKPSQQREDLIKWFDEEGRSYFVDNKRIDAFTGTPRAIYQVDHSPFSGTPEQAARQYLSSEVTTFRLQPGLQDIQTKLIQESPAGYHVRFQQTFQNIPVYGVEIVVSLDCSNRVMMVMNNYKPTLSVTTTIPVLSSAEARRTAEQYLGFQGIPLGDLTTTLVIFPFGQTQKLTYRITLPIDEPRGDWEIFVDALTGEIVAARDISLNSVNGSGHVFNPDPLTTAQASYGQTGYVDNNDSDSPQLNAQRMLVMLRDIKRVVSGSDTTYRLEGPYVQIKDWDLPTSIPVNATHPDSFRFTRSQQGFEDVMVYYHIDNSQRYIQSLEFTGIQNLSIWADPHGENGADNSRYYPSINRLTFGEGGVDDAEDADVILHEYGHAIHHGTVPGWSGYGQQGALGEGFGDFWAGSYSKSISTFRSEWVFNWDGHNPFWAGRILNDTRTYPGGLTGQIHNDGQMWSSTLMQIWDDIGRSIIDRLVLQSHYYLTSSGVTMTDNAYAVIRADEVLYNGQHIPAIVARFNARGFTNARVVTVRNSFDGGVVKVNTMQYLSGAKFGFPVGSTQTLAVLDSQEANNYMRIFQDWNLHGSGTSTQKTIQITVPNSDASYTANFLKLFNVSLSPAEFIEPGSGGTYKVDGVDVGPTWNGAILQYRSKTIEAVPPAGYLFVGWSDGETANPHNVSPTDHIENLRAIYKLPMKSNLSTALSGNSQRKLINSGDLYLAYESAGRIWMAKSTDGANTWQPESYVGEGSKPSISASARGTDITFNKKQADNTYSVFWRRFGLPHTDVVGLGSTPGVIEPNPVAGDIDVGASIYNLYFFWNNTNGISYHKKTVYLNSHSYHSGGTLTKPNSLLRNPSLAMPYLTYDDNQKIYLRKIELSTVVNYQSILGNEEVVPASANEGAPYSPSDRESRKSQVTSAGDIVWEAGNFLPYREDPIEKYSVSALAVSPGPGDPPPSPPKSAIFFQKRNVDGTYGAAISWSGSFNFYNPTVASYNGNITVMWETGVNTYRVSSPNLGIGSAVITAGVNPNLASDQLKYA
ncbi:MAG: hypothetical protein QME58_14170, partial [Bacteroidota bacterium]|nr:hypothetical protein [Bacteroidota bacterium]